MQASAPEGHKCSDCALAEQPCPTCYGAWWQKQHPNFREISVVTELPVGKYDAVRTLRHALQQAEAGKIKAVILICSAGMPRKDDTADAGPGIWACWSEMRRYEVMWCQRWFNSWLDKRYFGDYHSDDDDD